VRYPTRHEPKKRVASTFWQDGNVAKWQVNP